MIDPQVWQDIPHQQVGPAEVATDVVENATDDGNAEIAESDELSIFGLIERRCSVEMVDTACDSVLLALATTLLLVLVLVVASHISNEISRPSAKLLNNELVQSGKGSVLSHFRELMHQMALFAAILFPCQGYEDHVSFHMTSSLVVLSMRDLPGKVRDKQQ